ncbi:MAG: class I SAM-dependent methyltransferase [Patescibacteria group bacterium]|nr:class I SAM-dependent methyltransferase [Patescibacteria group bacterium]MDE2116599.1 class I SAM-dependent methyltransferase [Patescibacteria group bacterium]
MKTSWGNVADWYDKVVHDPDSYQSQVISPNLLRIVAAKRGDRVLDLACGQGFFSHALAAEGAHVTGIDIAPELVDIAREHASHNQEFYVGPADDLHMFKDKSFDSAVSVLAIQNIERMVSVFKEVSRVLRPKGRFVIVLNHPAFRIPGKSSWGWDEKGASGAGVQYRRVDEYMSESRAVIDMHPGIQSMHGAASADAARPKAPREVTYSFHRPLQVYAKTLANASFAIARIEEWQSHKESEKGPRKHAEDKARREIPLFMCLECVKL